MSAPVKSSEKVPTVEELTNQVNDLTLLVKKQSQLLSKTGEQVLSLQVKSQKESIDNFDPKSLRGSSSRVSKKIPQLDTTDFATNEDLVELVGELQGQLDVIEERSIRRLVNSHKKSTDILAPQLNHDGEEPPLEIYPKNVEEFTKISDSNLVQLARFYEALPPTEAEKREFEAFVEGKSDKVQESSIKVDASSYSKDDLDEAFDKVARLLGLPVRRTVEAW
ncbi:hypothetical protein BN7_387 [Wickerhamomyces ciferrii]|uniref:Uncharacterized protein n=1 Tax=Wickerhamomyces ciferrii (strain ATCC 14091 / BCRC 22168 / CBS 111 / JCM 3599 / NBRC 0793 / NRRL Y-1031 F-60-10) TaxID=1206466 RepID=K0KI82_WICCF|nr:uncharacterized protein BN7_387 [Wickerhamomyces ciferrii]CCH40853.1 hypothetical protein BN7_387 [Wickerhamomyces ciferrii]